MTSHLVLITSREENALNLEKKKSLDFLKPCFRLKIKRIRIRDQFSVFPNIEGKDFMKWENGEEKWESAKEN